MVQAQIAVIQEGLAQTIDMSEGSGLSTAFPNASISRSHFAYDYDISG